MTKFADHATRTMAKLAATQAQLGPLADEAFALMEALRKHDAIALSTPQSMRLFALANRLEELAGRSARIPSDFPMARSPGWPWDDGDGR